MIRIRRARLPDEEAVIYALDIACFPADALTDVYGTPGIIVWWIAWDRRTPVAFAGVDTGRAYLCRVGVLPTCRGLGIHQRLIRSRLAYLRAHGIDKASTYTSADNIASANNLIRTGFRLTGSWESGGQTFLDWERKGICKS